MWIPSKNHKYGWNSKFLGQKKKKCAGNTAPHVVCVNVKALLPKVKNNMYTKIKINCSYNTSLCLEVSHMVL